ncbi:MAG: hypothetical protein BRC35_12075 [Cyanobacteria bacterium QH_10_48_56]|nr:MAG: hypothetical protein BRC35_12075 [Cyanobacteria bacterium QH_10_48_56]
MQVKGSRFKVCSLAPPASPAFPAPPAHILTLLLNLERSDVTQLPPEIANLSDTEKRSLLAKLLRDKARQERTFPLSFAQQRLWFLDQLEPGSHAYNIPVAARLSGELDVTALESALNEIVRRHEVLRATFQTDDRGDPVQVIEPELTLSLAVIDLRARLQTESEESVVRERATQEAQHPFDLSHAPLIRANLLRLADAEHVILLTLHHIIADGWSMGVLVRELAALYEAFSQGEPSPLPELPIQYADYAVWQRQHLQGETWDSLLSYWRQQLGGSPPTLKLPTDRTPSADKPPEGATLPLKLPAELSPKLKKLCQEEGVTLFMALLAAFQTLLHRYSNQEDILVGTDVANRQREETEPLIGFFVNLVVLRTDFSGNPTFRELLRRVRQVALGAYAHQELPFEKLVEALQPERQANQVPLVQVLFVLQNTPMPAFETSTLSLKSVEVNDQTSKFNLGLFVGDREGQLVGNWRYRTDLFDTSTIERLSQNFAMLLESIVANPDTRLNQLKLEPETNNKRKQRSPRLKKLKHTKPKAVSFPSEDLVKISDLEGESFPLVIQPAAAEVELAEWASQNREYLEKTLLQHGAILLRGFQTRSATDFETVAQGVCPHLFGDYGDLPRESINGQVYGATPYPAEQAIRFHNESSHMHCWPQKLFFCCLSAAQEGGATPIVDCRRIYQQLEPEIRDRFERKGLMYARNYTEGLDVSWQDFFHTDDPSQVEEFCHAAGIEFEWKGDNCLATRQYSPAVIQHPQTGEKVFFNQIQLHHIACLEPTTRSSLLSLFSPQDLPRHVFYGDGTPISDEEIQAVLATYEQEARRFQWQEGDIVILDNMITAHGRDPYLGDRKVVVAMGEMISKQALS